MAEKVAGQAKTRVSVDGTYRREVTSAAPRQRGGWRVVPRPGSDPKALTGLAKITLSTGEILRFDVGRAPGNAPCWRPPEDWFSTET
jgi:hypothetical protein